ncbi:unnamed protein product [Effrenium voratum]|nr:unnamed protein product [Effrenium voratum]
MSCTVTSVAAAARAASEQTWALGEEPPKEAGTGGQSGWEDNNDTGAASARKEVEVLKAKLSMAQDQLKAERLAHGQSAIKALSGEVAALSQALGRERQESEREKAHLKELVRQAKEDLRQVSTARQGDSSGLLPQLETLRRMLSFVLLAHVAPDAQLARLGGATAVGGWNLSQAVSLTPSGRNRWTAEVNVSAHGFRYFEYKYVKLKEDHTEEWEHTIFNRNLLSVPFVDFTVDDGAFAKPLPPPPNQLGMRGPPLPRPKGEGYLPHHGA